MPLSFFVLIFALHRKCTKKKANKEAHKILLLFWKIIFMMKQNVPFKMFILNWRPSYFRNHRLVVLSAGSNCQNGHLPFLKQKKVLGLFRNWFQFAWIEIALEKCHLWMVLEGQKNFCKILPQLYLTLLQMYVGDVVRDK